MADAANDVAALNGLFKDQFHSDIENLIPQHAILQRGLVEWVPSDKQNGEFYSVPTLLRSNQGVTYLGEAGSVSSLKDAKPGVMKEAQIKGSEINVRGQLGYKALSQAATAGARAFKKAMAWLVDDLANVAFSRVEIAALYGQTGLGKVESIAETSATVGTIVITEATFAPGIWVLLEGATIDSFTGTAINNSDGALTITNVNTNTRTLTVTYAGGSPFSGEVSIGDDLYFEGAYSGTTTWSEMIGLYKQFTDTSSTLFNIARATYTLAQGNTKSSVASISKAKIVDAAMLAVDKGCLSDLVCLVSTKAWAVLNAEDMALRTFDSSYNSKMSKSGANELVYENVNGQIKVVCHPMVKYGEAFIFNPEDVLWVGSAKPTFEIPGRTDQFFDLVSGKNAVELQNYADLAIYALKPAQCVMMTGITYS
jgi:hypothetical protein